MKKGTPLAEAAEPMESKQEESEPKDYEIDSAMEDLLRAEMHKKNSKLMAKVHEKLGKKKEAINSIVGLKQKRAKLVAEDMD